MNRFAVLVLLGLFAVGCSKQQDEAKNPEQPNPSEASSPASNDNSAQPTGPVIWGITPAMQAEMRELVKADNPEANAAQVVDDYLAKLLRVAHEFELKPQENGDYVVPQELEVGIRKLIEEHGIQEAMKKASVKLPAWANTLLNEYEAGTISPARKELLQRMALAEILPNMA